ncbi:hypothetical protein C5167_027116 [Papaver somniferum]|nr:hypothetical protein C5167_027116 [Papaver somniferum]
MVTVYLLSFSGNHHLDKPLELTWYVIFPSWDLDLETSGLYLRNVGPQWHPTTSVATRKIVAATMAGNQNYPEEYEEKLQQ